MLGPTDHHLKPPGRRQRVGWTHGHHGWRWTAGGTATRMPGSGTWPSLATYLLRMRAYKVVGFPALTLVCALHAAMASSPSLDPSGPVPPLLFFLAPLLLGLDGRAAWAGPPAMCLSMYPYSKYTHVPCRLDVCTSETLPYACLPCR